MQALTPLKAGDKVGIVSTARKISLSEIQEALAILKSWGLEAITGKSIDSESFQFAGDDELRRNDLQSMLDDESVKAILFARGGYGTVRIIDDIDWRKFLKAPKCLCGFSDITVIHSHLLSVYEMPSVHSMMAFNFSTATSEAINSLREILFGEKLKYEISPHVLNRNGNAKGILCGGNISLLVNLLGSVSDVNTNEKILFIEEVDEHFYHFDRMIVTLKRAGKFENLAGLVVGHCTDMKNKNEENPFGKSAYEIIAEHITDYDFPVCFGFPAGHEPDNRTLTIGVEWNLSVAENSASFEESVKS